MAFRSDITIYWHLNPRIIEIAAPSVSITIQDLYDTLKELEQYMPNNIYPKLCDGFGKLDLGGGLFTIINLVLLDAKVKWEDRSGPNIVQCDIYDGDFLSYDTVVEAFVSPIEVSAFTQPIIRQATTGGIGQINVEGLTLEEALRVFLAALAGKVTIEENGTIDTLKFYARNKSTPLIEGTIETVGTKRIRTDADVLDGNL